MNTNPAGYTYSDYLAHKDDELYHFGIKGMKWGVRKDRGSSGGRSRRTPLTPEQKARRKKIALQAGGAALIGASLAQNYRLGKRAEIEDTGARVAGAALRAGAGLYALHRSEQLRQQSMKTKDESRARQLRSNSRWMAGLGAVNAPWIATATYGVHRIRDKQRRQENPSKYRKQGYRRA